jgi:hypothetical protein
VSPGQARASHASFPFSSAQGIAAAPQADIAWFAIKDHAVPPVPGFDPTTLYWMADETSRIFTISQSWIQSRGGDDWNWPASDECMVRWMSTKIGDGLCSDYWRCFCQARGIILPLLSCRS